MQGTTAAGPAPGASNIQTVSFDDYLEDWRSTGSTRRNLVRFPGRVKYGSRNSGSRRSGGSTDYVDIDGDDYEDGGGGGGALGGLDRSSGGATDQYSDLLFGRFPPPPPQRVDPVKYQRDRLEELRAMYELQDRLVGAGGGKPGESRGSDAGNDATFVTTAATVAMGNAGDLPPLIVPRPRRTGGDDDPDSLGGSGTGSRDRLAPLASISPPARASLSPDGRRGRADSVCSVCTEDMDGMVDDLVEWTRDLASPGGASHPFLGGDGSDDGLW